MLHIDHFTLHIPVTKNYTYAKLILYNAVQVHILQKKKIDMLTHTHAGCNKKIWHLNFHYCIFKAHSRLDFV